VRDQERVATNLKHFGLIKVFSITLNRPGFAGGSFS